MQRLFKLLLVSVFWFVSIQAMAGEGVMAENAWIREAPPGASALAGYLTLHNHGDKERSIVGAGSPAFGNVMLHRTEMEKGMAKMVHQKRVNIPAGKSVTFKPNDYHLMMMKPKHALKAGDKVEVTLEFKNGESLTVTHVVRGGNDNMGNMGGMGHAGMNHGGM